ncbi:MAG: TetR/AcrR family transcriptional regulator [Parvularcula sp.]|jgi:AcrR family transcriptional regulator|nr:TetR/AcrR family transcriptional regulator [Parvularcula sp.]
MMALKKDNGPEDLREACLAEALDIISSEGVEHLSLREVARRLGVSHQAPYRHFASRDHVLAEVVRRAFTDFAAALRTAPHTEDPAADAMAMGFAYVNFALTKSLKYRLMFGGSLPDSQSHPEMMHGAREAFNVLRASLRRLASSRGETPQTESIDREALFAWSSLHGVVSLLRSDAIDTLDLAAGVREAFVAEALQKIGIGLGIANKTNRGPS